MARLCTLHPSMTMTVPVADLDDDSDGSGCSSIADMDDLGAQLVTHKKSSGRTAIFICGDVMCKCLVPTVHGNKAHEQHDDMDDLGAQTVGAVINQCSRVMHPADESNSMSAMQDSSYAPSKDGVRDGIDDGRS